MAVGHAGYAKAALLRHVAPAKPSPLTKPPRDVMPLNYLLMITALGTWSKSKAAHTFTLQNVTLAMSLMLPWIFGLAGILYMLVAVYVRSTILTHEEERERWREAARITAAGGKLDTPRGGAPPPLRQIASDPSALGGQDGVRTLSDVVRGTDLAPLPLEKACHKRNMELLNEWRQERRQTIAGKPAGHQRAQSWPPPSRAEILGDIAHPPPVVRAPSCPPTAPPSP